MQAKSLLVRFDSEAADCRHCTYLRRFGQSKQILASMPTVLQSQDSVMEIRLISYLHLLLKLDELFFPPNREFLFRHNYPVEFVKMNVARLIACRNANNCIQAS